MFELSKGTLVQHASLGMGKVVAVEPNALHVFFPGSEQRFAAKLRLPAVRAMLRTEGLAPDPWLAGLSAFALDPETGRYGLSASWLTHEQAVAQFLAHHPEGFGASAKAAKGEPVSRWGAARAAFEAKLGHGEGERLLEAGDLSLLVKRALDVDKVVGSLHPPADVGAVKATLADPDQAVEFFTSLFALIADPRAIRARHDALFTAARSLPGEPAQQWVTATLFPFLAAPERFVLLRPRATLHAADRLGCDLGTLAAPVWAPYAALRAFSIRLLESLAPQGAKDFADVEAFLSATGAAKRPSARSKP